MGHWDGEIWFRRGQLPGCLGSNQNTNEGVDLGIGIVKLFHRQI